MTGFGAISIAPWLLGALAVATIWGGLWWLLSATGFQPGDRAGTAAPASAPDGPTVNAGAWQQPSFAGPARITVVTAEGCHFCEDAHQVLNDVAAGGAAVEVQFVDATSPSGLALLAQHRPPLNPLVLVDGAYFSAGRLPRRKLEALLETRVAPSEASEATHG